jgi:hypothetical protein
VLAVGGTVPTPPRLAVAVGSSLLEGDGVRVATFCLERGENSLERRHQLNEVVADDFLAAPGMGRDPDNPDSPGSLIRRDADSNPRPMAIDISGD